VADPYRHVVFQGKKTTTPLGPLVGNRKRVPLTSRKLVPMHAVPPAEPELCVTESSFVKHVLRCGGFDPVHYRLGPLVRRVPACLRALRVPSIAAARHLLAEEPARIPVAVNSLFIGTTGFFRDSHVFDILREEIIPDLLRRPHFPKVWSAACSEGTELYSVAMLLAEHGPIPHGHLFGSDCRPEAIHASMRGWYPANFLENLPPEVFGGHLGLVNGRHLVSRELRDATRWEVADVFATDDHGTWDMILCRNLAIYLDATSIRALWEKLIHALAPDGILVVGKAEKISLPGLHRLAPCIYQKTTP
jgi:chemotaxis methyl-accepting protein methylase